MTTTPTDPDAFDLETLNAGSIPALIAATEALRARVKELEGVLSTEEVLTDEYVSRAKAAEAYEVEVAVALEEFCEHVLKHAKVWEAEGGSHHHPIWSKVAGVLAAPRAEALERAKAVEECVDICRDFVRRADSADLDSPYTLKRCEAALAKLDALGKKGLNDE